MKLHYMFTFVASLPCLTGCIAQKPSTSTSAITIGASAMSSQLPMSTKATPGKPKRALTDSEIFCISRITQRIEAMNRTEEIAKSYMSSSPSETESEWRASHESLDQLSSDYSTLAIPSSLSGANILFQQAVDEFDLAMSDVDSAAKGDANLFYLVYSHLDRYRTLSNQFTEEIQRVSNSS